MKTIPLLAITAIAACGAAFAQSTPPPSGSTTKSPGSAPGSSTAVMEYSRLDKDKDGMISKKEAASNKSLTAQWSTLDVNKDSKLDEAEFAQFEAETPGP